MITAVWRKIHTRNMEWGTNMFGNVLGKLFSKTASNYGDDILRTVATNYGDDIARNIGQQTATPVLSQLMGNQADDLGRVALAPRKSFIGDAFVKASDVGLNAPLSITRKGMREVGKDTKQKIGMLLDRTGMINVDELRSLGKELTGGKDSYLDQVTDALRTNLGKGNNVDLNDLQPQLRNIRDSLKPAERDLFNNYDPVAQAKALKRMASSLRKRATPSAMDQDMANLYETIGREIDSRIDMGVNPQYVKEAFYNIPDEFATRSRAALLSGDKAKSEAYKRLAKEIAAIPDEQRTIQTLRSFKKDFVDISKMGELSDQAAGGGAISRVVNQMPVIGPLLDATLAPAAEAAAQKAGKTMRKVGRKFQSGEAQKTLKTAAGVGGGLAILNGLTNGNGGNNQSMTDPTMMMAGAGMDGGNGTNRTGAAETPSAEPTVAGYTQTQLENAYVAALMDNNLEAAKAIGTMIDMADSKQARADKLETTGTKSKQATQSANAARMMNNLMQTYQRGGGAQGGVGALNGLLNKVTFGAYNPNQAAYENMLQAAAVAVARANGEVGVLSNQDIQNYKNMLPTFADNPQQAQIKLQTIMSGLQGME